MIKEEVEEETIVGLPKKELMRKNTSFILLLTAKETDFKS